MRSMYADPEHWSTITLIELVDLDAHLITGVNVQKRFRGKGYASALLDRVCEDADREGATLVLDVNPDGTGLTYDLLMRFYGNHGFEPWEEAETGMIRRPKEKVVA